MDCIIYPKFKKRCMKTGSNWETAVVIQCLLLEGGGAFDPAHEFVADVIAGGVEMDGGGYARLGMSARSISVVGSNAIGLGGSLVFSAPLGRTAQAMVIYLDLSLGDSGNPVIGFYTGGVSPNELPKATTGGTITCSPHPTDGWIKM